MKHYIASRNSRFYTRRSFLRRTGGGFGSLALAAMLGESGLLTPAHGAALNPLSPRPSHFSAKAKSVIWLFMNGGQSQVDTFDYKPMLEKLDGQDLPGFDKKTGFFPAEVGGLMKSPFRFERRGKSGTWTSELFPRTAEHVDDLAFI